MGKEFWVAITLLVSALGVIVYGTAYQYEGVTEVVEVFEADVIGYSPGASGKNAANPKFKLKKRDAEGVVVFAKGNIDLHYRGGVLVEKRIGKDTGIYHYFIRQKKRTGSG